MKNEIRKPQFNDKSKNSYDFVGGHLNTFVKIPKPKPKEEKSEFDIEAFLDLFPLELNFDFYSHGLTERSEVLIVILAKFFGQIEVYDFKKVPLASKSIGNTNINLYDYSLDMYRNMIEICNLNNVPEHIRGPLLIVAFTHNFGKCPKIKDLYEKANNKRASHSEITIWHVSKFLDNYPLDNSSKNFIVNMLKAYHSPELEKGMEYFLQYLYAALDPTRRNEPK